MKDRYKIVLFNKNIYREIELTPDKMEVILGTGVEADVRLHKEYFFGHIEIKFFRNKNTWSMTCADGIYFSVGDSRKLFTLNLKHGDEISVRYNESNNEIFHMSFMYDFEYENKDYSCEIDISKKSKIKISHSKDADIQIKDNYFTKGEVVLFNEENGKCYIQDNKTAYGVYVNGAKIENKKELKERDFFSVVGYSFYYKNNTLYTCSDVNINTLDGTLRYEIKEESKTNLTYPKFNRNTRVQYAIPEEEIEVKQPVAKPTKPKKNLLMSLIPSLIMLAMTIVLRGIMGGGGTFVIYSAVSMSLGIITSVITYVQDGKEYKVECEKRVESYNKYIKEKEEEIELSRTNELRVRNLIYESLEDGVGEVSNFGRRLFERTRYDKDFLQVYLGTGRVPSANQLKITKTDFANTEDELSDIPQNLYEKYQFIDNAPIISDFNSSCGIGIVGAKEKLMQMLKNITLDLAIRHFYGDVNFVYIFDENTAEKFSWISWLRNVYNEQLDIKNIGCDEESKNAVLEYLYAELSAREHQKLENKEAVYDKYYVIFVTDVDEINNHPVSKYIEHCNKYGFTFVFFEEYEEKLPLGCTEIIRLDERQRNTLIKSINGDMLTDFEYKVISDDRANEIALKLSSVFVDEVSLESELTKNITLFELLGILSTEDLNLEDRWNKSEVYKSLAAPLGVKNKGTVVSLDISDKAGAHGPHGLVAGTTGSGKSEILQSYILSMVTLFHPYEVGFIIIDFKGGGMSNQFTDLPHLIGTITNIDGREINRSLLSIKAELVKRQEMFSKHGVNHINDYIKLYRAKKVTEPMPHLIMIVDEFAELKAEYPDFMKELISAARIGRTLGVHLILATQKPSGVVDPQIWSNSKFKLCLKVQTKEDSNEVLKTPLAAEIVEPGRAYFQVGNNEIFELFQSAYSGAGVPVANEAANKVYAIYEKNLWGKKKLVYTNKKKKDEKEETISQLKAIVDYVGNYCKENNISKLPGICLPSLPDRISTNALDYTVATNIGIEVPFGIYDDPERQKQGNVTIDFTKESIYIVGSSQMGKTVLLQTIAFGLIKKYSPSQVNMYMVDCGSNVLKIFENSAHVGGVVLSTEEEKCKNLFKLLNTIVIERKRMLSDKGIGNYASYLEAGYTDLPLVVVMIDNMAAFKEYFQAQVDELGMLTREAQGVGISFIITAPAANALNYKVQANFTSKLVLNCNESSEYSNVLGRCKTTPKEVRGRGLMLLERRIVEWQVAIFGESDKESDRSEELKNFIETRNTETNTYAKKIPMVPERLELKAVMKEDIQIFRKERMLPVGISYADVEFSYIDMKNTSSLALIGNVDGMTTLLNNMLVMLYNNIVFHNIEAFVIDDKFKKLSIAKSYGFVRDYVTDVSDGMMILDDFYDAVREREDMEEDESLVLLILNNAEVLKKICADKNASKEFANTMKQITNLNAFIIVSQMENQAVGFSASEVLKTIKEEKRAVLFAPIQDNKFFEASRVKADTSFEKTNAYYFADSLYTKLRIFE